MLQLEVSEIGQNSFSFGEKGAAFPQRQTVIVDDFNENEAIGLQQQVRAHLILNIPESLLRIRSLLTQFNNFSEKELGISVNLTGVFLGTKHAARAMMPSRRGGIINVDSVSSSVGGVASHTYTSSKHAVMGLTRNVATKLRQYGICMNCVLPHFILAPLTKEFFKIDESTGVRVYSNLEGGESTGRRCGEGYCVFGE
ncbi:momilactone A synthase-like [Eucalyptus grandis]|uniref:momilactone A synthase-like n=1 Tax=Eucalyptus grandis TaxID=71139 RepID=UPI00192F0829|nr:momilactone A synthase-like [Eucalyptus grandis]